MNTSGIPLRVLSSAIIALAAIAASPAFASSLTMGQINLGVPTSTCSGTVCGDGTFAPYAVISLGSNSSISMNSGPVTGDVLIGDGVKSVSFNGGGNGQITGTLYVDPTTAGYNYSGLQTPPTVSKLVDTTLTAAYLAQINTVAFNAEHATVDQTFASLSGGATITATTSGVNVIDVGNITTNNSTITLNGSASTYFVINISGTWQQSGGGASVALTGGVTADHVLWNFTGTSGNVWQTSGGGSCGGGGKACFLGTFLATNGGNFQFSNLDVTSGQVINTDGNIQFVSGSTMAGSNFTVPLPPSLALLASGLLGLIGVARRKVLGA